MLNLGPSRNRQGGVTLLIVLVVLLLATLGGLIMYRSNLTAQRIGAYSHAETRNQMAAEQAIEIFMTEHINTIGPGCSSVDRSGADAVRSCVFPDAANSPWATGLTVSGAPGAYVAEVRTGAMVSDLEVRELTCGKRAGRGGGFDVANSFDQMVIDLRVSARTDGSLWRDEVEIHQGINAVMAGGACGG